MEAIAAAAAPASAAAASTSASAVALRAFHNAVLRNDVDLAQSILDSGAVDIHEKDERGYEAIVSSILLNYEGMLRMLISRGADMNTRYKGGSLLRLARLLHHDAVERILIERGPDTATDGVNVAPSVYLSIMSDIAHLKKTRVLPERVRAEGVENASCVVCLESPADLLVMRPCEHIGCGECLRAWKSSHDPWTCPVCRAPIDGTCGLDRGDSSAIDEFRRAVIEGDIETVRRTLASDPEGPMDPAKHAGYSPLILALNSKHETVALELLTIAPPDVGCKHGHALHFAARAGFGRVVDALLGRGAKINANDEYGRTPLHAAIIEGNVTISRALIARGADINAKDCDGRTPLHMAIEKGSGAIARALIERGADIKATTRSGETPLDLAFRKGDLSIAKPLLARGLDADTESRRVRQRTE
jgi:ankyrin repeat protein